MSKKPVPQISPLDRPVLLFIWWWKLASTAAVTGRFYPDRKWSLSTVHWRLSRLKAKGLLTFLHCDQAHGTLWSLTALGFRVIEPELPKLRESGFGTENVVHDHLVQAVHLGNFLPRGSAPGVRLFSEQELRRLDLGCYPEWVPTSSIHRPDGYWRLPVGASHRIIALEVELSLKSFDDYKVTTNFYNLATTVDAVLWVIKSDSLQIKVNQAAKDSPFEYRDVHQFVRLAAFKEQGWAAPILSGSWRDRKVSEFLEYSQSVQGPSAPHPGPGHDWTRVILDARLKRANPLPWLSQEFSKNPD